MSPMRFAPLALIVLAFCSTPQAQAPAAPPVGEGAPSRGLVVRDIGDESLAPAAGLREGDVVLAWRRDGQSPGQPPVGGRFGGTGVPSAPGRAACPGW